MKNKPQKHYTKEVFLQNRKKTETEMFAFWVITFEPNKI